MNLKYEHLNDQRCLQIDYANWLYFGSNQSCQSVNLFDNIDLFANNNLPFDQSFFCFWRIFMKVVSALNNLSSSCRAASALPWRTISSSINFGVIFQWEKSSFVGCVHLAPANTILFHHRYTTWHWLILVRPQSMPCMPHICCGSWFCWETTPITRSSKNLFCSRLRWYRHWWWYRSWWRCPCLWPPNEWRWHSNSLHCIIPKKMKDLMDSRWDQFHLWFMLVHLLPNKAKVAPHTVHSWMHTWKHLVNSCVVWCLGLFKVMLHPIHILSGSLWLKHWKLK